jgi:hypothetical protein
MITEDYQVIQDPIVIVNKYNGKTRQLSSNEDRTHDYRTMLMEENRLYAIDLDLICLKYVENKAVYVAGLELTRIGDHHSGDPDINFFIKVINRYRAQGQKKLSVDITSKLHCPSIIVAFSRDLMDFYLYNLTKDDNKWYYQNRLKHLEWHYLIRDREIPKELYKDKKNDMKSIQGSFTI